MIREKLDNSIIIIDGAMGTEIQKSNVTIPLVPEELNITHPDVIYQIHRKYVLAGADVITTNSFGLNRYKVLDSSFSLEEHVKHAIKLVKDAKAKYVGFDLGPSGKLIEPIGDVSFDEIYEVYKEIVIEAIKHGVDVFLLETFNDLYELKAAILAIKEQCDIPIFCTMTFDETMHTLSGTDPFAFIQVAASLGVDALGVNCSLGPEEMVDIVNELVTHSPIPVIVQPNRGLPKMDSNGTTYYDLSVETYVIFMNKFKDMGVNVLGGCCGTDDLFVKALINSIDDFHFNRTFTKLGTVVSSYSACVDFQTGIKVIGERINPTGKKLLKQAIKSGDYDYILKEAIKQKEHGADILDVNMGVPGIDEVSVMTKAIKDIQSVVNTPLQIDSTDPSVIEAACRYYNGRPLINSVNGEKKSMDAIFPIVKKYGALVLGLTLDEDGLPKTAEKRVEIARKLVEEAKKYGIDSSQILIDALTLTVSAEQDQAIETLKAIRMIKKELGLFTVLGASNISFGLPNRTLMNTTFINMAFSYGLDAPIMNPLTTPVMDMINAYKVLNGEDSNSVRYITTYKDQVKKKVVVKKEVTLEYAICNGLKEDALQQVKSLISSMSPSMIIDQFIIPVLFDVGERFEKKEVFLPELIQAADASSYCLDFLKQEMKKDKQDIEYKGKIVIATVKGDIHDIGKNITKTLLENNGFLLYDLGKDVDSKTIIDTMVKEDIRMVGLSALMTTTVRNMEQIIIDIKEYFDDKVYFVVGGAVLTQEYADMIGSDYYAKDAQSAVKIFSKISE